MSIFRFCRRTSSLLISCVVLLSACSGSSTTDNKQSDLSAAEVAADPSVAASQGTSSNAESERASVDYLSFVWSSPVPLYSSETKTKCRSVQKEILEDIVSKHRISSCTDDWAVGMSAEKYDYLSNCDGGCDYDAETIYGRNQLGKWVAVAQCSIYHPLVTTDTCFDVMRDDIALPDLATLCKLWSPNSYLSNISITRCEPDPRMLGFEISDPCQDFYEYDPEILMYDSGIGKCNQGQLVCAIQRQLRNKGYDVEINAKYSEDVMLAVMHYQFSLGLVPSSHIHSSQWSDLFKDVSYSDAVSDTCNT